MPKELKSKSQDKPERSKPAQAKPAAKAETPAGPTAKEKPAERQPARTKTAREKRLARVPEQYVFYCCDGSLFRDMQELAAGLAAMTDDVFAYHSNEEKCDFSNWVRDIIEDIELANDLAMARSRLQAAECVADRIILLSR
jgi:hypothetical protein